MAFCLWAEANCQGYELAAIISLVAVLLCPLAIFAGYLVYRLRKRGPGGAAREPPARDWQCPKKGPAGPFPEELDPEPANETDGMPIVLSVMSPNGPKSCNGEYLLVRGQRQNGQPFWEKKGGKRFLFSGSDGKWHIGGSRARDAGFSGSRSFISCTEPHRSNPPDEFMKSWQRKGWTSWLADEEIQIMSIPSLATAEISLECKYLGSLEDSEVQSQNSTVTPPTSSDASTDRSGSFHLSNKAAQPVVAAQPMSMVKNEPAIWARSVDPPELRQLPPKTPMTILHVRVTHGQTQCHGLYDLLPGECPNGQPLWKKQGASLWLFYSKNGRWCIGGEDVKEEGFVRSAGFIAQTVNTRDKLPHECDTIWQQWCMDRFMEDDNIVISDAMLRLKPPTSPRRWTDDDSDDDSTEADKVCKPQQPLPSPMSPSMTPIKDLGLSLAGWSHSHSTLASSGQSSSTLPSPGRSSSTLQASPRSISTPAPSRQAFATGSLTRRSTSSLASFLKAPPSLRRSSTGNTSSPKVEAPPELHLSDMPEAEFILSDSSADGGMDSPTTRVMLQVLHATDVDMRTIGKSQQIFKRKVVAGSPMQVGPWLQPKLFSVLTKATTASQNESFFSIAWKPPRLYLMRPSQQVHLVVDGEPVENTVRLLTSRSEVQLRTSNGQRLLMVLRVVHYAAAREASIPQLMHVMSPNRQRACNGEYELTTSLRPNGQPLWAKRDGKKWLYSGTDGRWYIGGPCAKALDFKCSTGHMYNPEIHNGRLPHQLESSWAWADNGMWHEDPVVRVSTESRTETDIVDATQDEFEV